MKKILFFILLFLFVKVEASLNYCDNGEIDLNEQTCSGGLLLGDLSTIDSFSGSYHDFSSGFFGNNFDLELKKKESYKYELGYLGNHFIGREIIIDYYNMPVGYIPSYIGKDIEFDIYNYKFYSGGTKKNIFDNEIGSFEEVIEDNSDSDVKNSFKSSGSKKQECVIDKVEGTKLELLNNGYSDYIRISWEETSEKIKILQVFPIQKMHYIEDKNSFELHDLESGKNYMFYVITYNDCLSGVYSDKLKLEYDLVEEDKLYLTLEDGFIFLKNPQLLSDDKVVLQCNLFGEEVVNEVLKKDFSYDLNSFGESGLSCFVSYFDDNGELLKSSSFYNYLDISNLTNKNALEIILGREQVKDYFERYLYYLYDDINLDSNLDYHSLSLIILNVNALVYTEDKNFSLRVLKNMGLLRKDISGNKKVSREEFLSIIGKVEENISFIDDVIFIISTVFELTRKQLFDKLQKNFYINRELKNQENTDIEKLESCYMYKECLDFELYRNFDQSINDMLYEKEYKNLGIYFDQNLVDLSYYVEVFYKIYSKEFYYNGDYNLIDFEKFIKVLKEAVLYNEFYEEKLDYFSYNRLNLLTLDTDLYLKLGHLIKHHDKIVDSYENINDKSKLFNSIKNYLISW